MGCCFSFCHFLVVGGQYFHIQGLSLGIPLVTGQKKWDMFIWLIVIYCMQLGFHSQIGCVQGILRLCCSWHSMLFVHNRGS